MNPARRGRNGHQSQYEQIPWHALALGEVFARLGAKRGGLDAAEAERRLKQFGFNEVTAKPQRSIRKIFPGLFFNPLRAVPAGFKKFQMPTATVKRGGAWQNIPAREVVPGDIILLHAGDQIPADARITTIFHLKTEEGLLTGESREVLKNISPVPAGTPVFERANTVFGGTWVFEGGGEGLVFATGKSLEVGGLEIGKSKIFSKDTSKKTAPLGKKVGKLGRLIGLAVVVFGAVIFAAGVAAGRTAGEMFFAVAAVAVAAVPEGLPMAVTVILASGMRRILKEQGLVRSLYAAEVLGSASVILTDKTGALTEGEMRVSKVMLGARKSGLLEFSESDAAEPNRLAALSYAFLVSDSQLSWEAALENGASDKERKIVGASPVDKALVRAALEAGVDLKKIKAKFRKIRQIPFSSRRKFSAAWVKTGEGDVWEIVLGAPEVLLNQVKEIQVGGRYERAWPHELAAAREAVEELARRQFKVLAVCARKIQSETEFDSGRDYGEVLADLNLMALLALKDKIRPDVKEFMALSRQALIRSVMVTGDHAFTAREVARSVGLARSGHATFDGGRELELMEGREIELLEEKDLARVVRSVDIFSRVTPEHKLKITRAWQAAGESVAVIGDGVNDVLALKQADIGVALAGGTALARDAADVVLLDGGLSTLVKAIAAGRVILDNIKKAVAFLLGTGLAEVTLVMLSLLAGRPLALTALQILWVNLASESWLAMALGLEPAEKSVMRRPPPGVFEPILDGCMRRLIAAAGLINAMVIFLMFVFFQSFSGDLAYARSVACAALGVNSIFMALAMRGLYQSLSHTSFFSNRYIWGAAALALAFLALAMYLPPFQAILAFRPLGFLEWLVILGGGLVSVMLVEAAKWLLIKKHPR